MHTLAMADGNLMVILAAGMSIAVISVILNVARSMHRTREQERSRRELAAYVAEGSMTPADAERLLRAGLPEEKRCAAL